MNLLIKKYLKSKVFLISFLIIFSILIYNASIYLYGIFAGNKIYNVIYSASYSLNDYIKLIGCNRFQFFDMVHSYDLTNDILLFVIPIVMTFSSMYFTSKIFSSHFFKSELLRANYKKTLIKYYFCTYIMGVLPIILPFFIMFLLSFILPSNTLSAGNILTIYTTYGNYYLDIFVYFLWLLIFGFNCTSFAFITNYFVKKNIYALAIVNTILMIIFYWFFGSIINGLGSPYNPNIFTFYIYDDFIGCIIATILAQFMAFIVLFRLYGKKERVINNYE